jgi:hydrogenase expression/formation protein HypE
VCIEISEAAIPVRPQVTAACEMLGFDPLYIANEGKLVAIVAAEEAENALEAMRTDPYGQDAVAIGTVQPAPAGRVLLRTNLGSRRVVEMLAGELLPRIC